MNDFAFLMSVKHGQGMGATRSYALTETIKPEEEETFQSIDEIESIMATGEWFRKGDIKELAKKHNISFIKLGNELGLSESDSGEWVCLQTEMTPENAPDEYK